VRTLILSILALLVTLNGAQGQGAPRVTEGTWQSEAFNSAADAALAELSLAIKGNGTWKACLSPAATSSALRPTLTLVSESSSLRVARAKLVPPQQFPAKQSLSAWAQPLTKIERLKFKTIGVDLANPTAPVTQQLVTLAGPTLEGYTEQNATWRITWQWDKSTPPRIAAIVARNVEEVIARSSSSKPVFEDATLAVIGQTSAYRDQLRFGNTHWRQRIELFNRFFKFGHHGLAIGDANGDGLDDVYVCQNGGLPNRLFLQQADGTAIDVAANAGVDLLDLTRAALFVDLDNDGDQDLVLAADTGLLALRNDGSGQFEARLRIPKVRNAFSVAAADYDNDGDLDLYVCRYFANQDEGARLAVPVPFFDANNGGGNFLIRNEGPAKESNEWLAFSDVTQSSGLDEQNNQRFSFAAVWEDIDHDGDQDLFVANDYGHKNLYLNENSKFRDIAEQAGLNDGGFGMSASSGDYDGDGRSDLYAGNMFSAAGSRVTHQPTFRPGLAKDTLTRFQRMARGNSLFRNAGTGNRFDDVSDYAGVTVGRWSWGSVFADLNNDGWQDLVIANGFVTGSVPDDL